MKTLVNLGFLFIFSTLYSQEYQNINKLLGYPPDTKLLIIHADDIGLSHATNRAVVDAFESNSITSGSMMVPCPWFGEFAAYAKNKPGLDVGIHFTMNSEWKYYKFDGVLSVCEIPSLLDKEGNLWPTVQQVAFAVKPDQMEKELRAQIDKALSMGVKPTHLDSHMGSMYVNPVMFRTVLKVAREYGLPVSLPFNLMESQAPFLKSEVTEDMVGVDNFMMLDGNQLKGDWEKMYAEFISKLVPGLNEIVVHLAYDDEEMKAICVDHEEYGSAWRQKDLNLVTSKDFKDLLSKSNVKLVTWREIQQKIYPNGGLVKQ